jgi:hypothetical protein
MVRFIKKGRKAKPMAEAPPSVHISLYILRAKSVNRIESRDRQRGESQAISRNSKIKLPRCQKAKSIQSFDKAVYVSDV